MNKIDIKPSKKILVGMFLEDIIKTRVTIIPGTNNKTMN